MMLLIVGLSSREGVFPVDALKQVDIVITGMGFKKEVQSVVKPGRQYEVTYDGPNVDKNRIEEALRPVAEEFNIDFAVDVEESVRFP